MKNIPQNFLYTDTAADDIDELFMCLAQAEPPTNFVENVMQAIAYLPQPRKPATLTLWRTLTPLNEENDYGNLC